MKIVMVCTGNTCRSPMAEGLMRRALSARGIDGVEVLSAGTFTRSDYPASHESVDEMRARGIDIRDHRSTRLTDLNLGDALVLCMASGHLREVKRSAPSVNAHTLRDYAGLMGDIRDPIGRGPVAYHQAAEMMNEAIEIIANRLAKEGV
ncbi:low molecular weight protein arginine phosphatase [Eubacteriales bacterium OttesenSCG-928-N13]|nr:low molecular weight protein arginine phosphatase [Eubacteriales bacterium OttesenSCG-928-N13]